MNTTAFVIAYIVVGLLLIAAYWQVLAKAGYPGWGAIIPIYNAYLLIKVAGKPGWWLVLLFIPVVNIVIDLLVSLGVARNFGKSDGFGIGIFFLAFIFLPIIAFGSAEYQPETA